MVGERAILQSQIMPALDHFLRRFPNQLCWDCTALCSGTLGVLTIQCLGSLFLQDNGDLKSREDGDAKAGKTQSLASCRIQGKDKKWFRQVQAGIPGKLSPGSGAVGVPGLQDGAQSHLGNSTALAFTVSLRDLMSWANSLAPQTHNLKFLKRDAKWLMDWEKLVVAGSTFRKYILFILKPHLRISSEASC